MKTGDIFKVWKIDRTKPIGLILDVDELLYDNGDDIFSAYQLLLLSRRIMMEPKETFPGKDLFTILGAMRSKYGISDSVDELVRERRGNYIDVLNRSASPIKDGVRELFTFLENNRESLNLKTAYATSSEKAFTDIIFKRIFQQCNLDKYVDHPDNFFHRDKGGLCSSTCWEPGMKKKPEPDVYLKTLEKFKLPSSQCVAFEDSQSGFEAARKAGLNVCVVPSSWSVEFFSEYPLHQPLASGICKLSTLKDVIPALEGMLVEPQRTQS